MPVQEQATIEIRKTLLLSLDDLLVAARTFVNPAVSRSRLACCLCRHEISSH